MRIGITGSSGVLGRVLINTIKNVEWIRFKDDISEYESVNDWITKNDPLDAIVHFAAIVSTAEALSNPSRTMNVNVLGTTNLLQSVGSNKLKSSPWIFIASSAHVYSPNENKLHEQSKLAPVSFYGMSKQHAEQLSKVCSELYNLKICIGRICSFTDPNQSDSFFIPALIKKIMRAPKNSNLFIPGLMGTRDFLSTRDICGAIEKLLVEQKTGIYNISSGKPVKLLDLAVRIKTKLKRNDLVIETSQNDKKNLVLDNTKLISAGFVQEYNLEMVLDEMVKFRRS